MKNAIILHGSGSTPGSFWFPWLKKELEARGYSVWLPELPNAEKPLLEEQRDFVLKNAEFSPETIMVSHSAGGPLALSVLERINVQIRKAILVAGYCTSIGKDSERMLQKEYDWKKIRQHCAGFVFINSDNDPWGCNDKQGRAMREKLGGKLLVLNGEGHFGSDTFKQPYKEFPLLLELLG